MLLLDTTFDNTPDALAQRIAPLLGTSWAPILFYVGFLAVPISTTVGMSIAGAMAIHAASATGSPPMRSTSTHRSGAPV